MTRPLLISDCDEVLLHMVRHFADWLGTVHEIDFTIGNGGPGLTTEALKDRLVSIQRGQAPDPHGWIERLF